MRYVEILPLLAPVIVPLAGAAIILIWYRKRRIGDAPCCRRCGYFLQGNVSGRCPECGLELEAGNIAHGAPQTALRRVIVAGALLGIAGFFGTHFCRTFDFLRVRPTGWLIRDLASSKSTTNWDAWVELKRRNDEGDLSRSEFDALVKACSQNLRTGFAEATDTLADWLCQGKLTAAQERTLCESCLACSLSLQEQAGVKGILRLELSFHGNFESFPPCPNQVIFWVRIQELKLSVDGDPHFPDYEDLGGCPYCGYTHIFDTKRAAVNVGKAAATGQADFYAGKKGDVGASRFVYRVAIDARLPTANTPRSASRPAIRP